MKRFTKISCCAAVVAASLAFTAQAETASTTVNVYAGLASVMELSCTDVNFGVWRVPTGTRINGATVVTLNNDDSTGITGSTANIALSADNLAPKAGVCDVTGSSKATGTGTASLSAATGSFLTNGGTGFNAETLSAPGTAVSSFTYALALSSATPLISVTGTASFTIQGTMSIPDSLVAGNYGGYKSPDITVSFTD